MSRDARSTRRGFTFVELLVVVLILGLLASLGMMRYTDLRNTARTSQVAGDIRTITVGAYNYYADYEEWPPEAGAGVIPAGLAPYLPGMSFERPEYTIDWDNFGTGDSYLVGITISSGDAGLMTKLERTLGKQYPYFVSGGSITYILVNLSGAS